jgi:catechol 2,3-dioxygenase-like lactoylglutathione lyase family enzyme
MPAQTSLKLSTLSYVIIYVKDTKKALSFYRDTLGMKVRMEEDGWVELDTGSVTVALHADEHHKSETTPGVVPVFAVDNVHEAYEVLKAKGIKFDKDLQVVCEGEGGKVGKCADFRDLDGNRLSVFGYANK